MKIALSVANMKTGGITTFVLGLSQLLGNAHHDVTIIAQEEGDSWSRLAEVGVKGYCLPRYRWESVQQRAQRFAAYLTVQNFDLLVVNIGISNRLPMIALPLLPDTLPVVLVLHNDRPEVYALAAVNQARWCCAVAVSPKVQAEARKQLGEKPIQMIQYGVALPTDEQLGQRSGWATPLRLLFVGRLEDRQKGIFRLSAILRACQQRQLAVQLTVVGDGSDREAFAKLLQEVGVSDMVAFHGSQSNPAVLETMRAHHLLLLPSNFEGLPIVLLEAQANGCVPIATRLPGITDQAMQEGTSGILADAQDVDSFVSAIATLGDPVRWHAFCTAGIDLSRQRFDQQTMGASYLHLFQAVLRGEYPWSRQRPSPLVAFNMSDTLPAPLLRLRPFLRKRLPLKGVVRRAQRQGNNMRRLLAYGLRRKLQASWLGLRTYWHYRTLTDQPDQLRRKTLLVVDYRLLRPEDSTLGRSNDLYIRLLQAQGWRVLLMPYAAEWDDHSNSPHGVKWDEPYAVQLRQQGFGVLSGWLFRWQRTRWLRRNANRIDVVLFRHLEAASAYLPLFQSHSPTKVVYLAPDLRSVRFEREYETTGNVAAWRKAQTTALQEAPIFQAADAILTLSVEEKAWIAARHGDKVFQMPLFFYPTLPVAQPVLPTGQTLLFVGNFVHRPNPDGLHWFVQNCLPLLVQQCPAVKLIVAGSFAQADIFALQSEQITVLGRVSDTQLTALYQGTRVVIAPLRFGAGVKGKVLEALAHGVPVVTTHFGVEGVVGLAQLIPPTDTPEAMVAALTSLLTDDAAWQRASAAGQRFIQQQFSLQAAQTTLTQLLGSLAGEDSGTDR